MVLVSQIIQIDEIRASERWLMAQDLDINKPFRCAEKCKPLMVQQEPKVRKAR